MFFFGFVPEISENIEPESGIKVRKIKGDDIHDLIKKEKYKQIAGLGVIQMASLVLGLDVLSSSIEDISKAFSSRIG